jgi:hypothetical protein
MAVALLFFGNRKESLRLGLIFPTGLCDKIYMSNAQTISNRSETMAVKFTRIVNGYYVAETANGIWRISTNPLDSKRWWDVTLNGESVGVCSTNQLRSAQSRVQRLEDGKRFAGLSLSDILEARKVER